MNRVLVLFVLLLVAALGQAQTGWSTVSREVERPFASRLQAFKSDVHTSIRPYSTATLRVAAIPDSALPKAAFGVLDKWAGRNNGRKFRWGPLVDASVGYEGNASGVRYRSGAGLWADLDAGSKLNFHVDGQGWNERLPSYLDSVARATQVVAGEGYGYGTAPDFAHYSWNAHVSWDAHKYINVTLGRGKNFFGEGHRSLFLSDEATSYPYLRMTTSVWRIKYVDLFAVMNDIRGADGNVADFQRKFTSMHYLSYNVIDRVNVAVFEAIVWSPGSDEYPRGFEFNYLNPVLFYRPTEFRLGSPDNALLGFALNVKVGKHVLFYGQVMLDEFLASNVRNGNGWYANKQAGQIGVNAHEAFGVHGLQLRAEWNLVRPFMYTHSDTRQNYAHMGQPLAHPYGSNTEEVLAHVDLVRDRWVFSVRSSFAHMGTDSVDSYGNNIFRPESERPLKPNGARNDFGYRTGDFQSKYIFQAEARVGWTLDPRSAMRLEASYTYRMRDPPKEDPTTLHFVRVGLVCHFLDQHPEQEVRYRLR